MSDPSPALRQAIGWVVRLHSGAATSDDAESVQQWRRESDEHEQAFRDAVRLWRTFGDATRRLVAEQSQQQAQSTFVRSARIVASRRALLGGAIAASLAGYLVVRPPLDLWPSLEELSADYRTAKGERRTVELPGSVSLTLNTQTSVAVRSTSNEPRIELISGEAAVSSTRAGQPPLVVLAANGRITASRAEFNARCLDGSVAVSCLDGTVDVELAGRNVQLTKNDRVTYSAAEGLGAVATGDPEQATAWRNGLLIVRDWPLGRVAREINRYRPGKIIVTNSEIAGRMVTGTFHLDRLDDFIGQARGLFGATVRALPGGIVLLS